MTWDEEEGAPPRRLPSSPPREPGEERGGAEHPPVECRAVHGRWGGGLEVGKDGVKCEKSKCFPFSFLL